MYRPKHQFIGLIYIHRQWI